MPVERGAHYRNIYLIDNMNNMRKIDILGSNITTASDNLILEYILDSLLHGQEKLMIVTPNPEIITYATKHAHYRAILNQAQVAIPDGIGVILAGWFLGKPLSHRITGVDFMEMLCSKSADMNKESQKKPITVGFLGGRGGVAEKAAKRLQKKYPGLVISFISQELTTDSFGFSKNYDQGKESKRTDNRENSGNKKIQSLSFVPSRIPPTDILFVALGFPKQEMWISKNLPILPVRVAMGVGGSFDYLSGSVSRAPVTIQKIGLEWFYRLICQPWRWRRQLALLTFSYLILKARVRMVFHQ